MRGSEPVFGPNHGGRSPEPCVSRVIIGQLGVGKTGPEKQFQGALLEWEG